MAPLTYYRVVNPVSCGPDDPWKVGVLRVRKYSADSEDSGIIALTYSVKDAQEILTALRLLNTVRSEITQMDAAIARHEKNEGEST